MMDRKQNWRPIPGFIGYYASNKGKIYSQISRKEMKQYDLGRYKSVKLRNSKGAKTLYVHRLVYMAFMGIIEDDHIITHLDGNNDNNNVSNLKKINRSTFKGKNKNNKKSDREYVESFNGFYSMKDLVDDFDLSKYLINKNGIIINYEKNIIKPHIINKKYKVGLYNPSGKFKNFFVHSLLAFAFIDNPEDFKYVKHKNKNPLDNSLDNLEWSSRSNMLEKKKIVQRDMKGRIINTFNSAKDAATYLCEKNKIHGIRRSCYYGKPAYGYHWSYK